MAIDVLSYKASVGSTMQAQKNNALAAATPLTNNPSPSKAISLGTAAANNAAGGADEAALFLVSIAASSSATVDLTSITDILNQSASLARGKHIRIQLLSASDDTVNGTAASYVTIGNNGSNDWVSQGGTGWFHGATSSFDVPNGGYMEFGVGNGAGVAVDGTHKIIKIANADAGLAAKVQISLCGGST